MEVTYEWLKTIGIFLENHGIASALVLFGCYCFLKFSRWIGVKIGPIFDLVGEMIKSHTNLVDNATVCVKSIDGTLKNLVASSDQRFNSHTDTLDDIFEELKKNSQEIGEINLKTTSIYNKTFKVPHE